MKSLKSIHISYRFLPTANLAAQSNFREYLHQKIPGYSVELLDWHNQLCKIMAPQINDWWLTSGSRLMAWIPPIYQPYFFASAMRDFRIANNIPHIQISECPSELKTYLKEIDPDGAYSYNISAPIISPIKSRLKNSAVEIREFLKMIFSTIKKKNTEERKEYDYLIYSHFFGINRWKSSGDHFYGKMLEELALTKKVLWTYYPSVKTSKPEMTDVIKLLKHADCEFVDWKINSFSELKQIIARFLTYRRQSKAARKLVPDISIGGKPCKSFAQYHYKHMVENFSPLTEWKIDLYFNHVLSLHSVKKVIYPFEDKGLERAICNQCSSHNVRSFGYAHAVHNDGHLYFNINSKMLMPPRPDKVLATGPGAAEWIKKKSCNSISIDILGSNRYRAPVEIAGNNTGFKVLVLIGQAHELTMLANWAEQVPSMMKDCNITIRPYPYSDHEEQKNAIIRLKSHYNIDVNKLSLEKQIEASDVVVFSSTSAAFEAMLLGRMCIYANLHDIVPLSPLKDKGNGTEFIDTNETAEDLRLSILKTKALSSDARKKIGLSQRNFAVNVYSQPIISRLESI